MKKKLLAVIMSVMILATALVGCSSESKSTDVKKDGTTQETKDTSTADTEVKTTSDAPVTLNVWVRDSFYDLLTKAADQYMQKTPNITINVEQPENVSDQLALALSSGETPDIVSMDCVLVPYFASIGALADITDEFNSLSYKDSFSGGLMDLASYQDKTYGLPFAPDVSVLLYNKDMFKEAGLDPEKAPASWDELVEYAQKLTNNDHYGYVYAAAQAGPMMFTYTPYIWSNGGDVLNADGTKAIINEPKAVEALQFASDLANKYKVCPEGITSYGWTEAEDAFKTQKSAMIVLGSSAVYQMITKNDIDFNVGTALIPAADGKNFSSFSGGDTMAMINNSKNQAAAWDFMQYLLSENIQVEEMAKNGNLPARSDLFDNQYFAGKPEFEVMKNALAVGKAPYSLKYNELYTPYLDAVQAAINNMMSAQDALDKAAKSMDEILAQ